MQNAPEDRDIDKYGEHAGLRLLVHGQPGRAVVDKHPPARCRPPSARSVETQAGGKEAPGYPRRESPVWMSTGSHNLFVCRRRRLTSTRQASPDGDTSPLSCLASTGLPPSSPGGFAWQRLKRRLHKPLVPSVPSRRSHSRTTNGRLCASTCCQGCRVSGSVPRAPFHGNWTQAAAVVVASDGREWACGCSAGWLWPVSCLVSVRWGDTGWEGHRTQRETVRSGRRATAASPKPGNSHAKPPHHDLVRVVIAWASTLSSATALSRANQV